MFTNCCLINLLRSYKFQSLKCCVGLELDKLTTYIQLVQSSSELPLFELLLAQDGLSLRGEIAHLPPPHVGQVLLLANRLDDL